MCGGLSIPLLMFEGLDPSTVSVSGSSKIAIFLLFNFAHFASSTVRLYTKPGASSRHWFLAYGFPLVALLITLCAIAFPGLCFVLCAKPLEEDERSWQKVDY